MAHIDAFAVNGVKIELTDDKYTEKTGFVDYAKQTEAGTTRRDVIRIGYLEELTVNIRTVSSVKATLEAAAAQGRLTLRLWRDGNSSARYWYCFISSFSADLIRDTAAEVYWDVSVTFKDLEAS